MSSFNLYGHFCHIGYWYWKIQHIWAWMYNWYFVFCWACLQFTLLLVQINICNILFEKLSLDAAFTVCRHAILLKSVPLDQKLICPTVWYPKTLLRLILKWPMFWFYPKFFYNLTLVHSSAPWKHHLQHLRLPAIASLPGCVYVESYVEQKVDDNVNRIQ